ncbi:MAG: glycosyltransferase family 39 protein, partial [Chloroflexota bacterium]
MTRAIRPTTRRGLTVFALPLLLAVAVLTRLSGLGGAVTEDEDQWMARAGNAASGLISGDRGRTYQTGHPGVLPMGLITLSLGVERTAELSSRGRPDFVVTALPHFLVDLYQARIPFLLLGAGLCALVAALVWRLSSPGVGLLAGSLLVTDPYWAAMSPVVGMDGLLAGFLAISLLALLLGMKSPHHGLLWISLSGLAWGLAALTKTSALYMLPALLLCALLARFSASSPLSLQRRPPLPLGEGGGEGRAAASDLPPA